MGQNSNTRAGDIKKFSITSHDGSKSIDLSAVAQEVYYREDVFHPNTEVRVVLLETGLTDKQQIGARSALDSLPIRGGEKVLLTMDDSQKYSHTLKFSGDTALYVNRVSDIDPGTQKDVYSIELVPREYLSNNQTRVVKRYDGRISDNVKTILTETLQIPTTRIETDTTSIPYNFIGNDRKPFYVCSWLAGKSIPQLTTKDGKDTLGASAGYFFFQTYDGFKFKSLDGLLGSKAVKRYIFSGMPDLPQSGEYDGKILSVSINRYIDLERNLNTGVYANRTLFFDQFDFKYFVRDYNIDTQKEGVNNIGKQGLDWVDKAFSQSPSRLMTRVLDIGTLPLGNTPKEQLKTWSGDKTKPTLDSYNEMVQSFMRYNQLFTIKTDVIIAGDFSLRAGQLIYCDFPPTTVDKNKEPNKESSGIYMIASLCHRISRTENDCYTALTLVRDTFGRMPFKTTNYSSGSHVPKEILQGAPSLSNVA